MRRIILLAAMVAALVVGCGKAPENIHVVTVDVEHGVRLAERPAAILGGFGEGIGQFKNLGAVAIDAEGHALVADNALKRIEVISPENGPLASMPYSADEENALLPETIGYVNALDAVDGRLYVGSRDVVWVVADGSAAKVTLEGIDIPMRDIAVAPNGDIFVAGGGKVLRFDAEGTAKGELSYDEEGTPTPRSVDVGADGTVYVGGRKWNCVLVYDADGTFRTRLGSEGTGPGLFPGDVEMLAVDDFGNLFVYDEIENTIEAFSADGTPVGQVGATGSDIGQYLGVSGVFVDPAGHRLFVADAGNYRVQVYDLTGADTDATDLVTNSDPFAPANTPDHVVLSLGADGNTSRGVAWRTAEGVTGSAAMIVRTDAAPEDVDWASADVTSVVGESVPFQSNLGPYRTHSVIFTDLAPGARYVYRVGSDAPNGWSDAFEMNVPDPARETIRIAVVGDTRTRMDVWSDVIHAVADAKPDFIAHTGDIISNGLNQDDWNTWFDAAKDVLPHIPFIADHGQPRAILRHLLRDLRSSRERPGVDQAGRGLQLRLWPDALGRVAFVPEISMSRPRGCPGIWQVWTRDGSSRSTIVRHTPLIRAVEMGTWTSAKPGRRFSRTPTSRSAGRVTTTTTRARNRSMAARSCHRIAAQRTSSREAEVRRSTTSHRTRGSRQGGRRSSSALSTSRATHLPGRRSPPRARCLTNSRLRDRWIERDGPTDPVICARTGRGVL